MPRRLKSNDVERRSRSRKGFRSRQKKHRHDHETTHQHHRHYSPSPREYRKHHHYSPSSSSSSSSSRSSSSSGSSSVSSSTKRRRTTPHFKYQSGEKLGHSYRVTRLLGTGTFGRVLQAKYKDRYYAIKVIKSVHKYIQSAKTERNIVKDLNEKDPGDQYHVVRYYESFYHHQFYCMVFETLGLSLYDLIKKNSHNGYPMRLVQSFSRQLLESIAFMHAQGYTHTDLKPENILLESEELKKVPHCKAQKYYLPVKERVKIIDFGGATKRTERHSSIINTRQYRSPEVILQCCQWNELSDVWSIGCIIAELYIGELLFPTHDDVEHLIMIEKNSGTLPPWMAKGCRNDLSKIFRNDAIDPIMVARDLKDFKQIDELKTTNAIFKNHPEMQSLLKQCLCVDPRNRISCQKALQHQFFGLSYHD